MTKIHKILIYIAATAIGGGFFFISHAAATAQRGYEAIGGEIFNIILPVLALLLYEQMKANWHECKKSNTRKELSD